MSLNRDLAHAAALGYTPDDETVQLAQRLHRSITPAVALRLLTEGTGVVQVSRLVPTSMHRDVSFRAQVLSDMGKELALAALRDEVSILGPVRTAMRYEDGPEVSFGPGLPPRWGPDLYGHLVVRMYSPARPMIKEV